MPQSFSLSDGRALLLVFDSGCAWHLSAFNKLGRQFQHVILPNWFYDLAPFHDWIPSTFHQSSRSPTNPLLHPPMFWASSIISSAITSLMVCPASKSNKHVPKTKARKVCWFLKNELKGDDLVQCDIWRVSSSVSVFNWSCSSQKKCAQKWYDSKQGNAMLWRSPSTRASTDVGLTLKMCPWHW